jgi:hypothetical protein
MVARGRTYRFGARQAKYLPSRDSAFPATRVEGREAGLASLSQISPQLTPHHKLLTLPAIVTLQRACFIF